MKKQRNGFTLMELLVAVGIVAILTALSFPALSGWMRDAQCRESASLITSALREGRTRAISSNLEHWVEIDIKERKLKMMRGNRAEGSSETFIFSKLELPAGSLLRATKTCTDSDSEKFSFNPNGTSFSKYICIMDENGNRKFLVGVQNSMTGRIISKKATSTGWP